LAQWSTAQHGADVPSIAAMLIGATIKEFF
jgi:hypothetical protein